jgi:hypothetical protein
MSLRSRIVDKVSVVGGKENGCLREERVTREKAVNIGEVVSKRLLFG